MKPVSSQFSLLTCSSSTTPPSKNPSSLLQNQPKKRLDLFSSDARKTARIIRTEATNPSQKKKEESFLRTQAASRGVDGGWRPCRRRGAATQRRRLRRSRRRRGAVPRRRAACVRARTRGPSWHRRRSSPSPPLAILARRKDHLRRFLCCCRPSSRQLP